VLCVPLQKLCGKLKTEARQKKKESANGRSLLPDASALDLAIVIRNGLTVGTERCSVLEAKAESGLELRLMPSEKPHDCNTDDIENQTSDREAPRVHAMPYQRSRSRACEVSLSIAQLCTRSMKLCN